MYGNNIHDWILGFYKLMLYNVLAVDKTEIISYYWLMNWLMNYKNMPYVALGTCTCSSSHASSIAFNITRHTCTSKLILLQCFCRTIKMGLQWSSFHILMYLYVTSSVLTNFKRLNSCTWCVSFDLPWLVSIGWFPPGPWNKIWTEYKQNTDI